MSASGTEANLSPWSKPYRVPEEIDILVNATSIGLFPKVETCPNLVMESLRPGPMVADVIPNPPRTALLAKAEQRGCITLDGLGMLVNQGFIGIKLWTGLDPDPRVMREALREIFRSMIGVFHRSRPDRH